MKALRRQWGHLHYRVDGPGGGQALVCLNSLGTDLRMWDALLPHLPSGLQVIRADKRGHGLSAVKTAGPRIEAPVVIGALISRFLKETNLA